MINEITYSPDTNIKVRLDKYLSDTFEGLSRSYIQHLIRNEHVLVNGQTVKTGYLLSINDKISLDIPEKSDNTIKPEDIPLDIYYEDNDVIVINKPKGMVVHPCPGHENGTLVNALMYHCRGSLSGINGVLRPGIVHRIDKDTTGLLIACKNDQAHRCISSQLYRHTTKREYLALCYNDFKEKNLTIDLAIGRNKNNRKSMSVVSPWEGRRAVTHISVMESFKSPNNPLNHPLNLIKCILETGRTHQIRVHMKYSGHPLAGDEVYGMRNDPLKGNGQYLHAAVLGFVHPSTGEEMIFEAPLPQYFEETLQKLRKSNN